MIPLFEASTNVYEVSICTKKVGLDIYGPFKFYILQRSFYNNF